MYIEKKSSFKWDIYGIHPNQRTQPTRIPGYIRGGKDV
jgi:hypothetical protein